ncbi:hypothetical protein JK203_08980 [Gluconobacter cerinus]|uniref:hypothetical protein n=1 Tax=Gluconobacter cerinus TaxID=38307 RepID=UPI001B8AD24C|nr:hypothetical protein [Gluconobacter cerinus]MBS1040982.1 hypothetical protein [Gluconobacter cerinus]MBS1047957.1 hypothetical protein [Gluconobacter cerinus]
MSGRTDTERLEWFDQNCARARSRWNEAETTVEWVVRDDHWRPTFRGAIDAAMDAEERG